MTDIGYTVEEVIAGATRQCWQGFEQCVSLLRESEHPSTMLDFGDEFEAFRAWSKSAGALDQDHASLDYQLRENAATRKYFLAVLEGLMLYLSRCISILTPRPLLEDVVPAASREFSNTAEQSPLVSDSESDSSNSWQGPNLEDFLRYVTESVDKLVKITRAMKTASAHSRSARAQAYEEWEDGPDGPINKSKLFEDFVGTFLEYRYRELHPNVRLRLQKAISRCSRQIAYRRKDKRKLLYGSNGNVTVVENKPSPMPQPEVPPATRSQTASQSRSLSGQQLDRGFNHLKTSSHRGSNMTGSTLSPGFNPLDSKSSVSSGSSYSRLSGNPFHDLPPPPPLQAKDRFFQCPYCCILLPRNKSKPRAWRNHLIADLQPYICVFEDCPITEQYFETENDWIQHERWQHNIHWACEGFGTHSPSTFYDQRQFENHFKEFHPGFFSDFEIAKRTEIFAKPSSILFGHCPFCDFMEIGDQGKDSGHEAQGSFQASSGKVQPPISDSAFRIQSQHGSVYRDQSTQQDEDKGVGDENGHDNEDYKWEKKSTLEGNLQAPQSSRKTISPIPANVWDPESSRANSQKHVLEHLLALFLLTLPERDDLPTPPPSESRSKVDAESIRDPHDISLDQIHPEYLDPEYSSLEVLTSETPEDFNELKVQEDGEHEWTFVSIDRYDGFATDKVLRPFVEREMVESIASRDSNSVSAAFSSLVDVYTSIVEHIPSEYVGYGRGSLALDITSLAGLLQRVEQHGAEPGWKDAWSQDFALLARQYGPDGLFAQLHRAIWRSAIELEPRDDMEKSEEGENLRELMLTVENLKSTLEECVGRDNFQRSPYGDSRRKNILKESKERQMAYEEKLEANAIMAWLSPLDFASKQDAIFAKAISSSHWLLDSDWFGAWISGLSWELFCYGSPGAGKTVFCSIVVAYLRERFRIQTKPVLYLYLDYDDSTQQTSVNLIGSLLKQLIQYDPSTPISGKIKSAHQDANTRALDPEHDELASVFQLELEKFEHVYIVIDGWDESLEARRLILALRNSGSHNWSIMVSSGHPIDGFSKCDFCAATNIDVRFHCNTCNGGNYDLCQRCKDIGATCEDKSHNLLGPYYRSHLEITTSDHDLERYIDIELEIPNYSSMASSQLVRACGKDPGIRKDIKTAVVKQAKGVFLLAKLQMASLQSCHNANQVKKALQKLPSTLDAAYEKTMERVKNQSSHKTLLALEVIAWITSTFRPLSFGELQHALATRPEDREMKGHAVINKSLIHEATQGLVAIEYDGIVRLIHQTARDYFEKFQETLLYPATENVATSILAYLNLDPFSSPCVEIGTSREEITMRLEKYPFFSYAAVFWGHHIRSAHATSPQKDDSETRSATFRLLRDTGRLAAITQAAYYLDSHWSLSEKAGSLHVCAYFGIDLEDFTAALTQDYHVNSRDPQNQQTALMVACAEGYTKTAIRLMNLGADINLYDNHGSNALLDATIGRNIAIVKMLIGKQGLNISARCSLRMDRTALMLATQEGYQELVEILLDRDDLDINERDLLGSTALYIAVAGGKTTIIALLLGRPGVDVNKPNSEGISPLASAVQHGYWEIVGMLCRAGADVNQRDRFGETPLHRAVDSGDAKTVRLLLGYGSDPSLQNESGSTPISEAYRLKNWDLTQMLLPAYKDSGNPPATHPDILNFIIQAVKLKPLIRNMVAERERIKAQGVRRLQPLMRKMIARREVGKTLRDMKAGALTLEDAREHLRSFFAQLEIAPQRTIPITRLITATPVKSRR